MESAIFRDRPPIRSAVPVLLGLAALACSETVTECDRLVEAGQWDEAVEECIAEHGRTGSAQAAVNAADGLVGAREYAGAIEWAGKAIGTPYEARAWYLTGEAHYQLEQTEPMFAALDKAIAAGTPNEPGVVSDAHYMRYRALRRQGLLRPALEAPAEAYACASEIDDRTRQYRANSGLFVSLREIGQIQDATRVLERLRASADPDSKRSEALILQYEGQMLKAAGKLALTRDAYERALERANESEWTTLQRSLHFSLMDLNLELGELDRARQHLEKATALFGNTSSSSLAYFTAKMDLRLGDPESSVRRLEEELASDGLSRDWEWDLEYLAGLAASAAGDAARARGHFERSIDVVETMRGEIGLDDCKDWMLGEKRQPYEALFRLHAESSQPIEALATVERAKARSFLDAIVASYRSPTGEDQAESALDRDTLSRVQGLEEILSAVSQSPAVATRPIDEVLEGIGSRNALIYFEAGNQPWRIALANGRVSTQRLAFSTADLRDRLLRFRATPEDDALATELGQALVPEKASPPTGTRLYVVADRTFGAIPFGALRRNGRFLIEDYVISYVPSLNALLQIESSRREATGPAVVLGDPGGDLPAARQETRDIAELVGVSPSVGGEADLAALTGAAGARLLHVATHGGLGPRGAWLELADGRLTSDTLVRAISGPEVVVLSSCASAAKDGPGMWGSLSAAFLISGSRTVIASLWSIEDRAAREINLEFYRAGGPADPAGALARAQRSLIERGAPVAVWAPFVALGSNREREPFPMKQED